MNGQENVGIGQYMTNVQGAESEAAALRNGYIDTLSDAMTFYIPVYQNMPEEACQQPADGNNNTYLESLSVEGYELTPEFSRSKTDYELVVGKDVVFVNINAAVSSSTSQMTGGGMVLLTSDITKAEIIVTSASGQTRTYTVTISKMAGIKPEEEEPAITSSEYIFDTYLKGVNELTELDEFAGNIQVTGGQVVIKNAKGEILSEGKITTGTSVVLQDKSGLPVIEYQVVIRGDVSGDGKINSADALGIQRHIVESRVMEGAYLEAADINQDGRVNSLDVLYVQKHIVGSYTIENWEGDYGQNFCRKSGNGAHGSTDGTVNVQYFCGHSLCSRSHNVARRRRYRRKRGYGNHYAEIHRGDFWFRNSEDYIRFRCA